MIKIAFSISCLLLISLVGCENKPNPDDNIENKEFIHRSIVFGEHEIDAIFTDKGEISIDMDNDNKDDIKIMYQIERIVHQDCCLGWDSIDIDSLAREDKYLSGGDLIELFRLISFYSLNDSTLLSIYGYGEINLEKTDQIDFNGLKWRGNFGKYLPIEFIKTENYLPIKIIMNTSTIYYGWIYFKCDSKRKIELINYKILE